MFAVVAIRYYFVLDDDATSWSWHSQLAVAILELLFTTTVYLGLLLTCMKLAVLGDDLDDKAYAPATWTEEENRPRSPIISRPVSPIEEPAYIPKGRSEDKSNFDATENDKKLLPTEMDGSKPFVEMDGTSQQLVEMEGSAQPAIEADSGVYDFKKPA